MEFNTIKIVRTGCGYLVTVDGELHYCKSIKELTDFLEGISA